MIILSFRVLLSYFVLSVLMLSILNTESSAQSMENKDSIAIIIGNQKYSETHDVEFAVRDAEAMKVFLLQKLGYREENIIVLHNVTLGKMRSWFGREGSVKRSKLWNRVETSQANVFVYYSGHGAPALIKNSKFSDPYLIPVDIDPDYASDGYSLKQLEENLQGIKGKIGANRHVILMLDACFSGDTVKGSLLKASPGGLTLRMPKADNNKIIRLSASAANEVAGWDSERKHGLFTSKFLQAVEGQADHEDYGNEDGTVSWKEMSQYLKKRVRFASLNGSGRREQNPEISDTDAIQWKIPSGPLNIPGEQRGSSKPKINEENAKEAFEFAKSIETIEAWDDFIKEHKSSKYARYAKSFRQKLINKKKRDEQRQDNKDREMQARLQALQIKLENEKKQKKERQEAEERRQQAQQYQRQKDRDMETRLQVLRKRLDEEKALREQQRIARYTPPEVQTYTAPVVVTPSFDCRRARKAVEKTICNSSALATLDIKIAGLYGIAKGRQSRSGARRLRNMQRAWIKQRNKCNYDEACIERYYRYQIQVLENY